MQGLGAHPQILITSHDLVELFLNQVHAGLWFLEIAFVSIRMCVCLCLCVHPQTIKNYSCEIKSE